MPVTRNVPASGVKDPASRSVRDRRQTSTLDVFDSKLGLRVQKSSIDTIEDTKLNSRSRGFSGARAMGVSFKQAVEDYLLEHYKEEIDCGTLCMSNLRHDPNLYQAVTSYKKRFRKAPFGILSIRDKAIDRFNRVVELGYKNAERRDRDAANKMAKRITRESAV